MYVLETVLVAATLIVGTAVVLLSGVYVALFVVWLVWTITVWPERV